MTLDKPPSISTMGRYALLQRLSDQGLDELVGLSSAVSGVPRALLALLGEGGGWFNEALGMKSEEAMAYFGLCAWALLQDDFFAIEDLRQTPQLARDPLVLAEGGVRFFAGRALRDRSGAQVGTFCVFDRRPRVLDDHERVGLATLCSQIESQLDLRNDLLELRKHHREQLDRIQLLEGVLRAAGSFAIISTDKRGTIRSFNPGAERLLGYRAVEVVGRTTPAIFHDEPELAQHASALAADSSSDPASERKAAPVGFETLAARARGGRAEEREWTWKRKDGSKLPVQMVMAPSRSEEGELTGFVAIGQDITARKAAERMKDEFLSVVSHELRTPLTAIRGSLGLLTAGALGEVPGAFVEPLKIACANSERMVHLVNDILDLAKIESGTFEFVFARVDAGALVRRAIDINRAFGDTYGVSIVVEEAPASLFVRADADRIVQALTNLMSNAAKFSPRGSSVAVGVRAVAPSGATISAATTAGSADRVRFWVRDQGPGIPEEFRAHVFKRFMQADASDHRQKGGTGLGLSIVRSIIQSHSGEVGFDTAIGRGTTFFFDLPVDESA